MMKAVPMANKQRLQGQDREPAAGERESALRRQQDGQRDRQQKNDAVHDEDKERGPARKQVLGACAPQLVGREQRVAADHQRAEHHPMAARLVDHRALTREQPQDGPAEHGVGQSVPAMEQARAGPDDAARDEQQRVNHVHGQRAGNRVVHAPQCGGEPAEEIRRGPPGERPDAAILNPGEQQEQTQDRSDTRRDDEQRRNVQ